MCVCVCVCAVAESLMCVLHFLNRDSAHQVCYCIQIQCSRGCLSIMCIVFLQPWQARPNLRVHSIYYNALRLAWVSWCILPCMLLICTVCMYTCMYACMYFVQTASNVCKCSRARVHKYFPNKDVTALLVLCSLLRSSRLHLYCIYVCPENK